jgi:hypothetical protein
MIDYLNVGTKDTEDEDGNLTKDEIQYRKLVKNTVGELKLSPTRGAYWVTDDMVIKLLQHRPSIEEMKLILRPMSYLSKSKRPPIYDTDKGFEHDRYRKTLQKQIVGYLLDQYDHKGKS